jgi:chromosome segregation ATPase
MLAALTKLGKCTRERDNLNDMACHRLREIEKLRGELHEMVGKNINNYTNRIAAENREHEQLQNVAQARAVIGEVCAERDEARKEYAHWFGQAKEIADDRDAITRHAMKLESLLRECQPIIKRTKQYVIDYGNCTITVPPEPCLRDRLDALLTPAPSSPTNDAHLHH